VCDPLGRTHRVIPDGTAVRGAYCGVPFEGIVRSHRGGLHFCLPEYTVDVHPPIVVLGSTRTEVRIDVSDDRSGRNRIEVA
jgi:hypothetical protein